MHSHHYTGDDPELFAGKRVVVLGMGNSAMDIAVEATQTAERVFLAARRGAWIVPKYVFGRPLDQFVTAPRIPLRIRQRFMQTTLRAAVGDMERYGLPKPDHRPLEAHPTISDTILTRLTHGDITCKPNIARLTTDSVVFADGSAERADVVVYGTGYKVSFPFFDPALVSAPDNELPLYKRVFHPELAGLYFIALLQPLGATMPLAEAQSEWICDHLTGRYALPPRAELLARHRPRARGSCAAATWRPSATRCRSTTTTTCSTLRRERKRGARLRRREATKEANRAALLAAAREAFAEHGFAGTGVRDVVRRTDLASGTFYNYFDSKEAIFAAVLEQVGGEARAQVREARLAAAPDRFLEAGFGAFFAYVAADPETFAFLDRNADAVLPVALDELREDLDGRLRAGVGHRLHGPRDRRGGPADRPRDADP